ncbi:protein piccolo isoform X2 [Biomphalaria glabrata]|nr:protein piccolo isoform X2 [Biomphalaria glabrata]
MIHGKNLPKWIPHYAAMKPSTYFQYRQHQTSNCYQLFHQSSSWKTSQTTSRCDFPQEVSVTPIISRNPLSILCIDYRHHQGPSTTRHNPIPLAASACLRGELAAFLHTLCWLYLSASAQYCPFLSFFCVAIIYWASVLLVQLSIFVQLAMGNEGSAPSSEESTPISDYPSMYSINSRLRSSVESTRAPSPMEAPEPDLSHLTPEEIAQIRSVMERAKNLQQEESTRARQRRSQPEKRFPKPFWNCVANTIY